MPDKSKKSAAATTQDEAKTSQTDAKQPDTQPAAVVEEPAAEVSEDTQPSFEGQHYASDHFTVDAKENLGRQVIEIKPTGWVGPGFEISATRVDELATLLDEIQELPEQE